MKIAHLILAHNQPLQLARLIDKLSHEDACFFIHIDAKTDLEQFKLLTLKERVFLISDRVNVRWGAYSIVQATINGFRAIVNSGRQIDYVNLLSGADYPIKTTAEIHHFLTKNAGKNFMAFESVHGQWHEAISRLTTYHLTNYEFPGKYFVQKWLNKLAPLRKMPQNLTPVGRSQWLTINNEAVKYILDYLEKYPDVSRFFKLTWAPDEIIFQTILYNSPFKNSMVNDNLRYIDWSEGKPSPKTFVDDDFMKLNSSDALFARKFDPAQSRILDRLDMKMQNN